MNKITVQFGEVVQLLACQDAVSHRFLPGFMLSKNDGQLDHFFSFEFKRRNGMQDITVGGRGGSKFDDTGWLDAL